VAAVAVAVAQLPQPAREQLALEVPVAAQVLILMAAQQMLTPPVLRVILLTAVRVVEAD
jgi:hypothetical protein